MSSLRLTTRLSPLTKWTKPSNPHPLYIPPILIKTHLPSPLPLTLPTRHSSSSTRWKSRQTRDRYARSARVAGLKSRAAFKLLDLDAQHHLFKPGQTVVDLGYAPGSWSQVAISRVTPGGRVVGIDILPVQPPRGVSTIQGNFLSEEVRREVWRYVRDPELGRVKSRLGVDGEVEDEEGGLLDGGGYLDSVGREDGIGAEGEEGEMEKGEKVEKVLSQREKDETDGRVVDVVLSDMSAPWDQTSGFYIKSITEPYIRMMNTSGVPFRDHAGSMDLCMAALTFCFDTLRTGGHFVCKFYQGSEDTALEKRLKRLFTKVHREKPESSRSESREAFFVALKRKPNPVREDILAD
ncbi:MAG: 2' O-ribose methyltransferase [Bogoriella megaspora]|nr:MAG: 2' O-ribose methyltransferase [Bogoriella megaspora]